MTISFAPLLPLPVLIALGIGGVVALVFLLLAGQRGTLLRAAGLAALAIALLNPVLRHENRKPEKDIALIVTDVSGSQKIGARISQATRAHDALKDAIGKDTSLELRDIELARNDDGTLIFGPLTRTLSDVPPDRLAGVIVITDGEIHDVPQDAGALPFDGPVHALITGSRKERDRKLTVIRAPVFGIVGEPVHLTVRVDDLGAPPTQGTAQLHVYVDGQLRETREATIGAEDDIALTLEHGGQNVIEIQAEAGPDELTLLNNRAVVSTNGVRDRLRVLLVTGEPHSGERTWRNLLKADPSVDLVHFTILRPPEKQDGTPIDELSLIAFPTRELFEDKLNEFDLIIFDRYRRLGVLPLVYLSNVADYVERGGALLDAAGPAFATGMSLYRTPLAAILPAQPTGKVIEEGFKAVLTEQGERHPVTAALPGANPTATGEPTWGRWFRLLDSEATSGATLMTGARGGPALVLDHVGEGRVAQLLSDESWLWARGFEGGGPQAELLRRLAHWLMKEPELEEEDLHGTIKGGTLTIMRRTMADAPVPVTVTFPNGRTKEVPLSPKSPGLFTATVDAPQMGLYRLEDGTLTAVAAGGPLNPREYADVRATDALVGPLVKATGGGTLWLESQNDGAPAIRRVAKGRIAAGSNWIGLRQNSVSQLIDVSQRPLLPPALALLLVAVCFATAWLRESR